VIRSRQTDCWPVYCQILVSIDREVTDHGITATFLTHVGSTGMVGHLQHAGIPPQYHNQPAEPTQPPILSGMVKMSTGQWAVMLCGWGIKTGVTHIICGYTCGCQVSPLINTHAIPALVALRSGRTSVSGRQTFPVPCSTCS